MTAELTTTLPDELRLLASAQEGVLTGGQITLVVGDRGLRRLVRLGRLDRVWHNAYSLPGGSTDFDTRLRAADLTMGRPTVACLHTAARLHGFDLSNDTRTHVLASGDWYSKVDGLATYRCSPVMPLCSVRGRAVMDAGEVAVRLACAQRDGARKLAILDAAVRSGAVRTRDLVEVADRLSIRGIRPTREMVGLADGRAESPGESWLRWVCLDAGLPAPTPQWWVRLGDGRSFRLDLAWPEQRIGCEYDGVEFHPGASLTGDRTRMNALTSRGWLIQSVTASMIWRTRSILVAELQSTFAGR